MVNYLESKSGHNPGLCPQMLQTIRVRGENVAKYPEEDHDGHCERPQWPNEPFRGIRPGRKGRDPKR